MSETTDRRGVVAGGDLTPEALDNLARLLDAATDGPWEDVRVPFRDTASHSVKRGAAVLALVGWEREEPVRAPADAALIVALRNAAPALIACARAALAEAAPDQAGEAR
jgi:hypothetical protein